MINHKVTVFSIVKNGERSIQKAIDSILNQDYINKEVLVQAGESSDGTDRILKEYGPKITLFKDKESCPGEAFWKTFKKCSGEIVCCLMADEIMQEGALTKVVSEFNKDQEVEVIHGDIIANDLKNSIKFPILGKEFNLDTYLAWEYCPHFSSSYFKQTALQKVGIATRKWDYDLAETELWYYLNENCKIKYVPFQFSEYSLSKYQLSKNVELEILLYEKRKSFLKITQNNKKSLLKRLNKSAINRFLQIFEYTSIKPKNAFFASKNLRKVIFDALRIGNIREIKNFFAKQHNTF
jgi:glycosyltransferase involved in cell wall biosynthesis